MTIVSLTTDIKHLTLALNAILNGDKIISGVNKGNKTNFPVLN